MFEGCAELSPFLTWHLGRTVPWGMRGGETTLTLTSWSTVEKTFLELYVN